jgi:transposase
MREQVMQTVQQLPVGRSRWTLASIRETLDGFMTRSLPCVWRWMQRFGLRYKRGRAYLHSPDPAYALKLAYLSTARLQAQRDPDRVVVLYQDELTYYRRPSVARAYTVCGSRDPKADLGYSGDRKCRVAGALNAHTGQFHAYQTSHLGVAELKRYYQQLEAAYPDARCIYLVQDNWPVHRHPDLLLFFLTSRLTPLWLPTYAPWTNPCEQVWRRLKQEVLHLHPFRDDWTRLQTTVKDWLARWTHPSPDLLHYVGLTPY